MAIIKVIEKEQAVGKVAEIYAGMEKQIGMVPNAFKLFSSSEYVLEQQMRNLSHFIGHPRLSGKLLAFVRLMVSEIEECKYCVGMNTSILWEYGVLPEHIDEIRKDNNKVPLEENEKAMLFFVLKVVKQSNSIEKADIDKLLQLGWTDADIVEATYHATSQVATDFMFNAFKIDADKLK